MTLVMKKFTMRLSRKPKSNRKPRFFLQNLPKPTDRKHFETVTTLLVAPWAVGTLQYRRAQQQTWAEVGRGALLCPFPWGSWAPSNTMSPGPRPTSVQVVPDPSSHLATTDIGQKMGGGCCAPFQGKLGPNLTQCHLRRGLPLYQVASWSIQLFGHNRHGPQFIWMQTSGSKTAVPLSVQQGELAPHLTQCGLGRGLPPHQVASWSIQLFGHSTPMLQTNRQDIQWSNNTAWSGEPFYKQSPKKAFIALPKGRSKFSPNLRDCISAPI